MFDDRITRLSLEIGGQLKVFEGLSIAAAGTKFANGIQNEVSIKVSGLSPSDRDYILTETSPFNKNEAKKKVILEAGRKSEGYFLVFAGDVIRSFASQPPDVEVELKAKTAHYFSGIVVSNGMSAISPLSTIAQKVSSDLGLGLRFEATEKNIKNYSYTGDALTQVDGLNDLGDLQAFVDDEELVVIDYNKPVSGDVKLVNKNTGMIGQPSLDIQGVTVKFLIDRRVRLGLAIQVESEKYPATNGLYIIYKLDFDISSRDTPWYYTAMAKRPNP